MQSAPSNTLPEDFFFWKSGTVQVEIFRDFRFEDFDIRVQPSTACVACGHKLLCDVQR